METGADGMLPNEWGCDTPYLKTFIFIIDLKQSVAN